MPHMRGQMMTTTTTIIMRIREQRLMTRKTMTDNEDNHRTMTESETGTDNDTTQLKQQQRWCMMRGMTRMGQEWKAQVMDTAPYDKGHWETPGRGHPSGRHHQPPFSVSHH